MAEIAVLWQLNFFFFQAADYFTKYPLWIFLNMWGFQIEIANSCLNLFVVFYNPYDYKSPYKMQWQLKQSSLAVCALLKLASSWHSRHAWLLLAFWWKSVFVRCGAKGAMRLAAHPNRTTTNSVMTDKKMRRYTYELHFKTLARHTDTKYKIDDRNKAVIKT